MTLKGTSIIGLDIISIDTSTKLETVTEVLYDPQVNKVIGLLVDKKGWFKDARVILIEDVVSIGTSAVMVQNEDCIQTTSDVPERVALIANDDTTLVRNKVLTSGGEELGSVSDIYLELPGGKVTHLEISQGLLKNIGSGKKLVQVEDIISIGEDAMVVSKYTEIAFDEQAQEQGLLGAVNATKEKASDIWDKTKEVAVDTAGKITEKSKEIASNVQETAKEAGHKIEEKASPVIEKLKEDYDSGKMEQDAKDGMQKAKDGVQKATQAVTQKAGESKEALSNATQETQEAIQAKRAEAALGKMVGNINILSLDDELLAVEGDIITHALIEKAKANNALDNLLNNVV